MKKTLLNTVILAITLISVTVSCNDNENANFSKSMEIKAVFAKINQPTTPPTTDDLSLIDGARKNNSRRVTSLLHDKKTTITAINEDGETAFIAAAKANNADIIDELSDFLTTETTYILDTADKNGQTAMHYAVENGAIESIKALREAKASTNIYNSTQDFPLNIAVVRNNIEALKSLIEIDSDYIPTNVDIKNASGTSALLSATATRNLAMITMLVDMQADVNVSDLSGITPLTLSVKNGDKELFKFLLQHGADINHISSNEQSALIYAIQNKRYDFTKFILDQGANPNSHLEDLYSPLQILANQENADLDLVKLMISKGALLSDSKMPLGNVISRAIKKGNAKIIDVLIKSGASIKDIEKNYSNGILEGFKIDDPEVIKVMIDNGVDINKADESGFSPLALSIKQEMPEIFKVLVNKGADVNKTSANSAASPINIVLDKDSPKMLDLMIKHGLNASLDSLLVKAIEAEKFKILPILIENGAKTDVINSVGQPMLWLCVSKNNLEAIKIMAEAGANLEVKDQEKRLTPLAIATIKKNHEITDYLLNNGANPNNADVNGITPLFYAALTGQDKLFESMIEKGGDINAKDNSGRSILTLMNSSKLDKYTKDRVKKTLVRLGAQ